MRVWLSCLALVVGVAISGCEPAGSSGTGDELDVLGGVADMATQGVEVLATMAPGAGEGALDEGTDEEGDPATASDDDTGTTYQSPIVIEGEDIASFVYVPGGAFDLVDQGVSISSGGIVPWEPVEISIRQVPPAEIAASPDDGEVFVAAVECLPAGSVFPEPLRLTVDLDQPLDPSAVVEVSLVDPDTGTTSLARMIDGTPVVAALDGSGSRIVVEVDHFSVYAFSVYVEDEQGQLVEGMIHLSYGNSIQPGLDYDDMDAYVADVAAFLQKGYEYHVSHGYEVPVAPHKVHAVIHKSGWDAAIMDWSGAIHLGAHLGPVDLFQTAVGMLHLQVQKEYGIAVSCAMSPTKGGYWLVQGAARALEGLVIGEEEPTWSLDLHGQSFEAVLTEPWEDVRGAIDDDAIPSGALWYTLLSTMGDDGHHALQDVYSQYTCGDDVATLLDLVLGGDYGTSLAAQVIRFNRARYYQEELLGSDFAGLVLSPGAVPSFPVAVDLVTADEATIDPDSEGSPVEGMGLEPFGAIYLRLDVEDLHPVTLTLNETATR